MTIIQKLLHHWRSLRYYVIADPADNSITLSRHLFLHIKKCFQSSCGGGAGEASVFVFRIPRHGTFGFMLNPSVGTPTQLCQIQYNGKHRCIGFETLCPSVGRIFYEYGLPALQPVKLSVSLRRTRQGKTYYQIDVPSTKTINRCKAFLATHARPT